MHTLDGHTFAKDGGKYVMSIALPFAKKEDVSLEQVGEGLEVHLDGRRCVFALPDEVRYREASSWAFEPPLLKVTFR